MSNESRKDPFMPDAPTPETRTDKAFYVWIRDADTHWHPHASETDKLHAAFLAGAASRGTDPAVPEEARHGHTGGLGELAHELEARASGGDTPDLWQTIYDAAANEGTILHDDIVTAIQEAVQRKGASGGDDAGRREEP